MRPHDGRSRRALLLPSPRRAAHRVGARALCAQSAGQPVVRWWQGPPVGALVLLAAPRGEVGQLAVKAPPPRAGPGGGWSRAAQGPCKRPPTHLHAVLDEPSEVQLAARHGKEARVAACGILDEESGQETIQRPDWTASKARRAPRELAAAAGRPPARCACCCSWRRASRARLLKRTPRTSRRDYIRGATGLDSGVRDSGRRPGPLCRRRCEFAGKGQGKGGMGEWKPAGWGGRRGGRGRPSCGRAHGRGVGAAGAPRGGALWRASQAPAVLVLCSGSRGHGLRRPAGQRRWHRQKEGRGARGCAPNDLA
jgi:hypothetical protein